MKHIKWGFIGCGQAAEGVISSLSMIDATEVVAVMSPSKDEAQQFASRHNIAEYYTDASLLINDPAVNAVYIATPPSTHPIYAIMAMNAQKPVLIETPLAASYDDCARINRVAQATGVACYVAYSRRYNPCFLKVSDILDRQCIVKVQNLQIRFSVPPQSSDLDPSSLSWRTDPEIAGAGYFYHVASEQFDIIQQKLGVITHARGYTANRANLYKAEDNVSACFQLHNGIPGSGSWTFVGHSSHSDDRIEILGNKGTLCFSMYSYSPIHLHTNKGIESFDIAKPDYPQLPMLQTVIAALRGEGTCDATSLSATPVNWVLDRILKKI